MGQLSDEPRSARVVVIVVRTGGLAGLRRQWRAEPPPEQAAQWESIIDECPWDADLATSGDADRYTWRIEVDGTLAPREAEVPDSLLDGPWLALVDAVREASPDAKPVNPRRPRTSASEQ